MNTMNDNADTKWAYVLLENKVNKINILLDHSYEYFHLNSK